MMLTMMYVNMTHKQRRIYPVATNMHPRRPMRPCHFTVYSLLLVLLLFLPSFCDALYGRVRPSLTTLRGDVKSTDSFITTLRGGSTPFSGDAYPDSNNFPPDQTPFASGDPYHDDDPPDHETVQERVNAWRQQQQSTASHMTPEQVASPRDERGRMKLLTSVSKGSRALIFFMLMWRDVHLYEVADQTFKGFIRLVTVIPLLMLFIGNLAGAVASVTSPSHSAKKRLKAILNLDKLVEAIMILYSFGRLTLFPSKYTPREIYIANTLHSVFFILQSQAFTRLTWYVLFVVFV